MHFCQDEANAIMQSLPFLGAAWLWLRNVFKRKFVEPEDFKGVQPFICNLVSGILSLFHVLHTLAS